MFKIFITESLHNSITEAEGRKPTQQRSNLYKILSKYKKEIHTLSSDETLKLKNSPEKFLNNPSSLYILDIAKDEAAAIQKQYGVMCLSGEHPDVSALIDVNDAFVSNKFHQLDKGWDSVLDSVETLPSNALILADRYLFKNIEAKDGDGFDNIEVILDQLLPQQFAGGDYHVCILFNKEKSAFNFSDIASGLEIVRQGINRPYPIKMEVIGFDTNTSIHDKLHNRVIISNYYMVEAGHKLAAFNRYYGTARQTIYPLALFTESSLMGASSAPLRAIKQNLAAIKDFSEYVTKVETFDKYLYALNGERKEKCSGIKNRLLK
ncbi:MAG: hypothetical protein II626_05225 [Prevotella sp.]|nr:hypothetical protein [Prevotella sp.]